MKGVNISKDKDIKQLATFTSRSMARQMLEQVAVSGEYTAIGFNDGFVRFVRTHDGIKEEVTGKKINSRSFSIVTNSSKIEI